MIHDPNRLVNDFLIRQLDAAESQQTPIPETRLYEIADLAAKQVKPHWFDGEMHFPGDRLPQPCEDCELPDEIDLDVTDIVIADALEDGVGSYVHDSPQSIPTPVHTHSPDLFVVDGNGKVVEDFRIIVRYQVDSN